MVQGEKLKGREEINLNLMRTFSLYAGPVVVLYRFIFFYSDPDAVDPLWLRLCIAGLFTSFFLASHLLPAFKSYATRVFQFIQYTTLFWLGYLTYLNNLSPSVTLGFIVVIVTIYFVFHTKKALAVYASVVTLMVVLLTVLAPDPEIVPLFFLSTVVVIAFFTYIILHSRLDAMDELDQKRAIMGTVFHESGDAFVVVDTEAGAVVSHNAMAIEALDARDPDDLVCRLCQLLSIDEEGNHKKEPADAIQHLLSVAPIEKDVEIIFNGDSRWIDVRLKSLHNNLLLAKLSDVTQDKQIDDYRIAKEAAEEATRLKDSFLATMSHELRTPMNGVMGMANLLNYTELDEEQKDYVETIRQSGDHLLSILNDILDFTRMGSGLIEIDQQPFAPVKVIEEVLELFALDANAKKIELISLPDQNCNWEVLGDSKRLWQILNNVVGNAVKFTHTGEILIKMQTTELNAETLELHFSVKDTGVGIPSDAQKSIFEHFKQVDGSLARQFEGIGLGLAITRQLVELLGGTIWVESILGKGSTFHWKLPVNKADTTAKTPGQVELQAGLSVLVLDDNLNSLHRIEQLLASRSLKYYSTSDPSEARVRLQNGHAFDLAIIDLFMPNLDSLELAKTLKQSTSTKLPILLLAPVGVKLDFTADVADAVVNKPILEHTLFKKIQAVTAPINNASSTSKIPVAHQSSMRVLLVEDNIMNQQVALNTLSILGYSADVADNGEDALMKLEQKIQEQQPYDLVFMDLQMPVMDGLEATRQIRARFEEGSPYIIALTANALQSDYEHCMAAGMNDFLSKPLNIDALKTKLEVFESSLV